MQWSWAMWMLMLSPVAFVLIGTGLIAVGIVLKRAGSLAARSVFIAGAGAYVGGLTCLLAWAVNEEDGGPIMMTTFFALTVIWVIGCLVAGAHPSRRAS